MALTSVANGQQTDASQLDQFINLLTGVMNDQPVTLKGDNTRASQLLTLDSVNTGQVVQLRFASAGTTKWNFGKDTDNSFYIFDVAGNRSFLKANSGGTIVLMPVAASGFNLGIGANPPGPYLLNVLGTSRFQALASPAAPTVTPTGGTGTTTYSYYVVAIDRNGNKTLASATGTTTTGVATLSGTQYNVVSWAAVSGAVSYDVIRSAGGAAQGSIALATTATSLNDTGIAAAAYTAPTRNATADVQIDSYLGIGKAPAQVIDLSVGAPGVWTVDPSGRTVIQKSDADTSVSEALAVARVFSGSVAPPNVLAGISAYGQYTSSVNMGAGQYFNGLDAYAELQGSGGIPNAYGVHAHVINTGTGTITDAVAIRVRNPSGTGPITNVFGIWISDQTYAGSTYMAAVQIGGTGVNNAIAIGGHDVGTALIYAPALGDLRITPASGHALTLDGHLISAGTAPAVSGVNPGISGTPTVTGDDKSGIVTFTTTASPPGAGGSLFTLTWVNSYGKKVPVIATNGQNTATFGTAPAADGGTCIFFTNGALAGATTYDLYYWIVGR